MKQLQLMPDANFISQHLGYPGEATNVQKQIFTSESQMDAAIGSTVPTKDKPYLTMNDKVFATRYVATSTTPTPAEAEPEEEEPELELEYDEEEDSA